MAFVCNRSRLYVFHRPIPARGVDFNRLSPTVHYGNFELAIRLQTRYFETIPYGFERHIISERSSG